MAGDWIKVRDDLVEDPAVGRIAIALGMDKYAVVGRLVRLWAWADRQSRDGHAAVSHVYLDDLVNTPGMADAMVSVGWLNVIENGEIVFPNFERHNGKSAKKRALATRRKQDQRTREAVTPQSRSSHTARVTREEKSLCNKHLPVANSTAATSVLKKVASKPPRSAAPRIADPMQPASSLAPISAEVRDAIGKSAAASRRGQSAFKRSEPLDWWETPEGVSGKGRECGLAPQPNEDFWNGYAPRVFEAVGPGPWNDGNVSHA